MAIAISPLDLLLDTENPRFVILQSREQADIRKYLKKRLQREMY